MATEITTIFMCAMCLEVLFLPSEDGVPTIALSVRPFEHSAENSKSFSLFQLPALCARRGNAWRRDEAAQCANYGTTVAATTKTAPNRGGARAFTPSPNTFSKIPSVSIVPLLLRQLCVHHIGPSFASSDRASTLALYLKMLLESRFLLPKASLLTFLLLFLLQNHMYFYRR